MEKMYMHFFKSKGNFGRTAVVVCNSIHASSGRKHLREELIKEYCQKLQVRKEGLDEVKKIVIPEVSRILKDTERQMILSVHPKFPQVIMQ